MAEKKIKTKAPNLKFELMTQVCSVIQDTGFPGTPEEYVLTYYGKPFAELTVCEAELIVRQLGTKPGCLYKGDPKDLEPTPEKEDNP